MGLFQQCKKDDTLSTEERTAAAQRLRAGGMGLMVSAMGCLIGVSAGLSSSIGVGGAIGVGIGASCGLFAAGIGLIKKANDMAPPECSTEGAGKDAQEGKEEATADV